MRAIPTRDAVIATRSVDQCELIAAKLQMAMWSALPHGLLVLVASARARVVGHLPVVLDRAQRLNAPSDAARGGVVLLILAAFIVSTWKQLVQSLPHRPDRP